MMSDTSLLDKFTKEIATLEKVANKSKADRTWWFNKAESFKELLATTEKVKKAISALERRIKEAKEKIRQLETKIATSESEIVSLKNRVLSAGEKVAKKKAYSFICRSLRLEIKYHPIL